MNKITKIVGIGEVLWDIYPMTKCLGGAPANLIYYMSQFGYDACLVSAIGKDLLGAEIIETLKKFQVPFLIEEVSYPTGTVQITLSKNKIPSYKITENVAWDHLSFTSRIETLANETAVLIFGSLAQRSEESRKTLSLFLEAIKDKAAYIICDINLRQDYYNLEIIQNALSRCNVLKMNDDELDVISTMLLIKGDSIEARSREIMERYNLLMVVVTCGIKGSYIITADGISYMETPQIKTLDTTGAGDAFLAAFCSKILQGETIKDSHRYAVAVSAYVCGRMGAMAPLKDEFRNGM